MPQAGDAGCFGRFPVLTLLVVGSGVLIAVIPSLAPWLIYDRPAILSGQIWRMFTGHWVHFSAQHLVYDLLALGMAGSIIEAQHLPRFGWLCLIGPWAISLALLVFEPQMRFCGGLSGLATSAIVFLAVSGLSDVAPWRWVCLVATLAIAGKLLLEITTGRMVFASIDNVQTVASVSSHIAGAALGLGFALGVGGSGSIRRH